MDNIKKYYKTNWIYDYLLKTFVVLCTAFIFLFSADVYSAEKKIEIGIDEQLGAKVPLNLKFKDETGKEVSLKELFTKPTVFAFVYYECPGICSPLMNSIAQVADRSDLVPGENYNIVVLSMDETEKPALADQKKVNYLKMITKRFPPESWKFLTGDSASIRQLADAAGFYYKRDGKQFLHTGAIIFISPEGKICRYLFPGYSEKGGYDILPFDFKMAVIETSQGKTNPTIARVLQYCFSYDPKGKTYVLNLTRIFGAGILLFAAIFVVYLTAKPKKVKKTR